MNTQTRTVSNILWELNNAKQSAHEELYHIILSNIDDPFTSFFVRSNHEVKNSFADKITEQIIKKKPEQAYYMHEDFLSEVSEEDVKNFNKNNDVFKIFLKDPSPTERKVTVTLKDELK